MHNFSPPVLFSFLKNSVTVHDYKKIEVPMSTIKPWKFLLAFFIAIALHLIAEELKPDCTLMVPMRDGTELPTDIYLPHPEAKGLPCILLRGPAGRHHFASATVYAPMAKAGYVVAIQDTRAATDLQGKTLPFFSDGWSKYQDGYDAVEWLAKHPLTNGTVGTLGISNMGITQVLMAPTAPPSLKCQYIGVAASSLYHHAIYPNGKLLKNLVEGWLSYHAKDPTVLAFVNERSEYNEFWEDFNALNNANKVKVPAVHQGGWYDIFLQGTLDGFVARQERGAEGARGKQKLLIGPWLHMYPSVTKLGEFEVPQNGLAPPIDLSPLSWFNHHLKGLPNKIDEAPAVTYYVMGPFDGSTSSGNLWRTAHKWPVDSAKISFFLTSDKTLTEAKPIKSALFTYKHDPQNLVPTIGGRNLFMEAGPMDQSPIEKRDDLLIFTTNPLTEDLEVTGRLQAKLLFSSDQNDTDLAVRLTDVYPDGRSILISDGITRTRNIESDQEGKKVIDVDLWSTSFVFAKGHRIRMIVSASNYPRYDKNETNPNPATHHIHAGSNISQLILPVVRKGDKWLVEKPLGEK